MPSDLDTSFLDLSVRETTDEPVDKDQFTTPQSRPKRARRPTESLFCSPNIDDSGSSSEINDDSVEDADFRLSQSDSDTEHITESLILRLMFNVQLKVVDYENFLHSSTTKENESF